MRLIDADRLIESVEIGRDGDDELASIFSSSDIIGRIESQPTVKAYTEEQVVIVCEVALHRYAKRIHEELCDAIDRYVLYGEERGEENEAD